MGSEYRDRVYRAYVSGRQVPLAPQTLEGLKPRLPYLRKVVQRHFPDNLYARVLDLGCGYGALLYAARQEGYQNVRGIDGSAEQVAAAKDLGVDGVEQSDVMESLQEQPDASLDCLIAFDLIEHFERNELILLVDAVYRVLKPGGCWIIHTPNAESPFGMKIRFGDLTHELAFTRTSIAQLLLSSGFAKLETFEDQPVPHGIVSTVRWLLWRGLRNLLRFYLAVETGDTGRNAIFSQNFLAVAYK